MIITENIAFITSLLSFPASIFIFFIFLGNHLGCYIYLTIVLSFQELESDIISDLGGHFRDVALSLLQTPQDFVAENIHRTLKVTEPSLFKYEGCSKKDQTLQMAHKSP